MQRLQRNLKKKEGASMCSVAQNLKAMGREEERLSAILRMIEKEFDKKGHLTNPVRCPLL